MTELEKQCNFSRCAAQLILFAYDQGYKITLGEAYRSPETAEIYAKAGKGIKNSLHRRRLAIDLNLFKDGQYLSRSEDYKPLGDYWKSLSCLNYTCVWGGDFIDDKTGLPAPDGNHFSFLHLNLK